MSTITPTAPMTTERRLLTAAETAERLSISTRSLWRLRDRGALPAPRRLATQVVRWDSAELDAWIAAGCPRVRS